MQLLRNKEGSAAVAEVVEGQWLVVDDKQAVADATSDSSVESGVAITLARYRSEPDLWQPDNPSWTVVIAPDDDLIEIPEAVLDRSELLISFPAFTDGRGYSHARSLRVRHGYTGSLVAIGDVRRDQLEFMRETGFTAYQITGNDTVEDMIQSLTELQMPAHRLYSGAALNADSDSQGVSP